MSTSISSTIGPTINPGHSPIPFLAAAGYRTTTRWVSALQQAMPNERIVAFADLSPEAKSVCTVAIVANPNPEDLQCLPQLQWVHSVWAGVERLIANLHGNLHPNLTASPDGRHLPIVRLIDPQLAKTMAEAVLAWTLYLHRDMPTYARQQAQKQWLPRDYIRPERKTVGLLGLGALGAAAAKVLSLAGFNVCAWSRTRKNHPGIACFSGEAELNLMLSKADILVCLLPLTPGTRGLLNAARLAALKPGAALINFARGPILEQSALLAALDSGHLSHAVLDVFDEEPLPSEDAYWQHPNVTVLPHCSAPTDFETASAIVAANILAYRKRGIIPASVDFRLGY